MPCAYCDGRGYVDATNIVPYGDTWVSELGMAPCPGCVERDLCPRCEGPLERDLRGRASCPACGWSDAWGGG